MSQFQKGDTVKVIGTWGTGDIGTVLGHDRDPNAVHSIWVEVKDGNELDAMPYAAEELELVTRPASQQK